MVRPLKYLEQLPLKFFSRLMTASLVLMAAALTYCKNPINFLLDLVFSPWNVILDM
jgi:hypothetical protein